MTDTSEEPTAGHLPAAGRYSARDVGSFLVVLLGAAIVASALVLNPWFGRLIWGAYVVDKHEVLWSYVLASVSLGAIVMVLGARIGRRTDGRADGPSLLAILLSLLILSDRLLLVVFGLPLWVHDPVLHYRHRPDTARVLQPDSGPAARLQKINRHGHHDTEFPETPGEGEFRGLMIGDSVTMGHRVAYAQTFTAKLEDRLRARVGPDTTIEVINAGVHGYATYQEVQVLRESLRFEPDFVAIGFCLNDLTEPSVVERGFDEAGVDYHGVAPSTNPLQGYFLNETGLGRLVQEIRSRSTSVRGEQRGELARVRSVSTAGIDDPEWREPWKWVLTDLEEMYAVSESAGVPIVLLIFPFTFQLLDEGAREPQRILNEHAERLGVDVIDFTQVFADRVYDDQELVGVLRQRGYDDRQIARVFSPEIRRYFMDNDHLTEAGHALVAEALDDYLRNRPLPAATR